MATARSQIPARAINKENAVHAVGAKGTTTQGVGAAKQIAAPVIQRRPALRELGNDSKARPANVTNLKDGLPKARPALRPLTNRVQPKPSEANVAVVKPTNVTAKPKQLHRQESTNVLVSNKVVPAQIVDVDANVKHDPFLLGEYVQDFMKYMMQLENIYGVKANFLESHKTEDRHRKILVNWLVDVHTTFKMALETLFIAVNYLDRFLEKDKTVGKKNLQLFGSAAMSLAAKYEEVMVPSLEDFVVLSDNVFTLDELISAEISMIKKLEFNMAPPTALHFLRRFSRIAMVKLEHHTMAKYLLEVGLLHSNMSDVKPSLQAAAALCISMAVYLHVKDASEVWSPSLQHYSTYAYEDLLPVMRMFIKAASVAHKSEFNTSFHKYVKRLGSTFTRQLQDPVVKNL